MLAPAFSPDGKFVASYRGKEEILILRQSDGQPHRLIKVPHLQQFDTVRYLAFGPKSDHLITGTTAPRKASPIKLWDVETGDVTFELTASFLKRHFPETSKWSHIVGFGDLDRSGKFLTFFCLSSDDSGKADQSVFGIVELATEHLASSGRVEISQPIQLWEAGFELDDTGKRFLFRFAGSQGGTFTALIDTDVGADRIVVANAFRASFSPDYKHFFVSDADGLSVDVYSTKTAALEEQYFVNMGIKFISPGLYTKEGERIGDRIVRLGGLRTPMPDIWGATWKDPDLLDKAMKLVGPESQSTLLEFENL